MSACKKTCKKNVNLQKILTRVIVDKGSECPRKIKLQKKLVERH